MHWLHDFAAPKPVGKHEFSDILDAHGFKPTSDQESQTLSSLKKEQNKPDDPIKAKVKFTCLVWLSWRIYFFRKKCIEKICLSVKIMRWILDTYNPGQTSLVRLDQIAWKCVDKLFGNNQRWRHWNRETPLPSPTDNVENEQWRIHHDKQH